MIAQQRRYVKCRLLWKDVLKCLPVFKMDHLLFVDSHGASNILKFHKENGELPHGESPQVDLYMRLGKFKVQKDAEKKGKGVSILNMEGMLGESARKAYASNPQKAPYLI